VKIPRFFEHKHGTEPHEAAVEAPVVHLDKDQLRELSAVFSAPRWLRNLGVASWLLVGVAALLFGLTWVMGVTSSIALPVLVGLIVSTVASPAVTWLHAHRVPRAAGAVLVLLALIAIAVVIVLLVIGGISSQLDAIRENASAGADKIRSWVESAGVSNSGATSTSDSVQKSVGETASTLIHGLAKGVQGIASAAFFLSFLAFSIFFILKDGPGMRRWLDRHLGVPLPVAQTITQGVIKAMRRYFLGTTIVAVFNAVVVGLGALVLDVPLAGTIAVVTLVTAYIPFIGAVVAGAFAVLLALGSQGTETALIMLVIVILANGLLQNIVSPIAMGATLRMNPLLILVVTISAGSFFGTIGMVIAAPLTSAAIHISQDLGRAREAARRRIGETQSAGAAPAEQPA